MQSFIQQMLLNTSFGPSPGDSVVKRIARTLALKDLADHQVGEALGQFSREKNDEGRWGQGHLPHIGSHVHVDRERPHE